MTANQQHVAALAFPFGTHAAPLLSLVRRLAAASPTVKFSFLSTARSNQSIFSGTSSSDNVKPFNVCDGIPEGFQMSGHPTELIGLFLRSAVGNFNKAMEEAVSETGTEITCLITDAFFGFAGDLAEKMNILWVPLWTSGPCSLTVHVYTDLIRAKLGYAGNSKEEEENREIDFIPGCSAIRLCDLPEGVVTGDLKAPMSCMLHNMGSMLPKATAVAINSFEEIDPVITSDLKSNLKMLLNVGPFTMFSSPSIFDEHGCISWLDNQKEASVTYISFGSVITPPAHELAALAEGLEESGCPFLWSFRGDPNELLPKGFLERTTSSSKGKIVPWAPQMQILGHKSTGVFVTHCGWNSITESITSGVPMICRPFFGDQSLNRRAVQDVWKIGLGFETSSVITKSETVTFLDLILLKDEGKKMKEKIKSLKELATKAVGPNGSSVKNFETLLELVTCASSNIHNKS